MKRWLKRLAASVVVTAMVACGGGGGGNAGTPVVGPGSGTGSGGTGGGSGSTASAVNVSIGLTSLDGTATSTVTVASPATARAQVLSSTGAPLVGQLVTFTTAGGLGTFAPASGTALTDANGYASVVLTPVSATAAGADQVIASVNVTDATGTTTTRTARTGFQLQATNVTIASVTTDVDGSTLAANGQTNVVVNLAGAAGVSVGVSLTSTCSAQGKATITPATATTTTGIATFSYKDNGCGASQVGVSPNDTLRASITGSAAAPVGHALSLTSATANSIAFISATPSTIYLQGSGSETSEVVFEVRDQNGNALPNRQMRMVLTTTAGGLRLVNAAPDGSVTQSSDANGRISVQVNSGTVPTPVRVRAALVGTTITSLSNNLTVAVGLPAQLQFSLAQKTTNIEGFDWIDTPNTYSVIASDRMGNPVRDGTTINFVSPEGGQVQSSQVTALTAAGIARADSNFVSSMPRPADGRITVVAYALGEESFEDLNGNNVYDCGEAFQDLGDIFVSRDYLAVYDNTKDQLVPLVTAATGTACSLPQAASGGRLALNERIPSVGGTTANGLWGQNYVRAAIETVLSTSTAEPVWYGSGTLDACTTACPAGGYIVRPENQVPSTATLTPAFATSTALALVARDPSPVYFYEVAGSRIRNAGATGTFTFLLRDSNGVRLNPVAAGTVVSATATSGLTAIVVGGSPVANTSSATTVTVSYEFTSASSGTITLNIAAPRGQTTQVPVVISSGP